MDIFELVGAKVRICLHEGDTLDVVVQEGNLEYNQFWGRLTENAHIQHVGLIPAGAVRLFSVDSIQEVLE